MLQNYSLTWVSAIIFTLAWAFKLSGVDFDQTQATEAINFVVQAITVVGVLWGRWRQGDLKNVFGKKK